MNERHYTVQELAQLWNMSEDFVARRIRREPGVVKFGNPKPGASFERWTYRVPASVAERIYRRFKHGG